MIQELNEDFYIPTNEFQTEITKDFLLTLPEEVAELIFFLASEKAGFITGQTIGIDGGFVI